MGRICTQPVNYRRLQCVKVHDEISQYFPVFCTASDKSWGTGLGANEPCMNDSHHSNQLDFNLTFIKFCEVLLHNTLLAL